MKILKKPRTWTDFLDKQTKRKKMDMRFGTWNVRSMYLTEIGWDGMNWIGLAQDKDQWRALVKMVMNLRVPQNAGKFLSSCTIGSFSRRAQLDE
jgi:hypothetical protein